MKILTANRLTDGEAVWLAGDRSWVEMIEGSEIARDDESEEKLERAGHAAFLKNEVVDVNLIDIELIDGAPVPVRLRERIRAAGPTNRLDLGKRTNSRIAVAARSYGRT